MPVQQSVIFQKKTGGPSASFQNKLGGGGPRPLWTVRLWVYPVHSIPRTQSRVYPVHRVYRVYPVNIQSTPPVHSLVYEPSAWLTSDMSSLNPIFSRVRNACRGRPSDSPRHSHRCSQCGAQFLAASHAPFQSLCFCTRR